jgi:ABC-type transport system involved in cytochrome c biogenesis permease subunit
MKRFGWLLLGLPLALATALGAGPPAQGAEKPQALGVGPAYASLSKLPVMHAGRKKPLDTLAREEIKQIFGRETIKLKGADDKVVATWGPVAAMLDWSVRPEFWDDQPIILVEYLPLKRLILADAIEGRLKAIADRPETPAADQKQARTLLASKELNASDLSRFAGSAKLSDDDRKAVLALAEDLKEPHKWLTPRQLESARVRVDGQRVDFDAWFRDANQRKNQGESNMGLASAKLTEVEKRGIEAGTRLVHYQAIRDRKISSVEPLLVMPHPTSATFQKYCGDALKKAVENQGKGLSPLELDSANVLFTYNNDIPREDRAEPGTNAEFDKNFTTWLKDKAVWVPLRVLLDTKPDELAKAGYPAAETAAFLEAFRAAEKAEEAAPGKLPEAKASALVAASRALGESINGANYPPAKDMDLEAYFNETNPFFRAPYGYGLALAILAVSLGFASTRKRTPAWWLGMAVYSAGMLALLAGIALEVLGFSMRVRISGWAPVTNMYETVIWVSLVSAVLGLVFELIFRKTYAALAGAGVALLGTVLAANVPLLDPGIHTLQPVLRSNYWLTIHVLTEVSSYAAFALAMGLGLIATMFYLTATYRRSPSFVELGSPLVPGLPLLAIGALGLAASYGAFNVSLPAGRASLLFYLAGALAGVGGSLSIIGAGAVVGELISRVLFHEEVLLASAGATAGAGEAELPATATSVQTVTVDEGNGAVATLAKPTVAEIRARAAQTRPKLDARGLAMQATAARIKPLSNFIYRTMQVGVLLIAAGTILGGVWADYSWGRFWGWDPKEVWALITLLIYLIPLHGRFAGWVNMFGLVISSVVCFLSVIMAWYGVNFVLGVGLHSYGFVEGGGQGIVGAVVLAVLALVAAAAWRRGLASKAVAAPPSA